MEIKKLIQEQTKEAKKVVKTASAGSIIIAIVLLIINVCCLDMVVCKVTLFFCVTLTLPVTAKFAMLLKAPATVPLRQNIMTNARNCFSTSESLKTVITLKCLRCLNFLQQAAQTPF